MSSHYNNTMTHVLGNSTLRPIPSCAITCTKRVFPDFSCSFSNRTCVCNPETGLEQSLSTCLRNRCTLDEQLATQAFQADFCDLPVHDLRLQLKITFWAFFGLAAAFPLARFLSRWRRLRGAGFWVDDAVVVVCAAFAVALIPITLLLLKYGMGRDVWELDSSELTAFLMWTWIYHILCIPIVFGTKLSLVLLYLRIWSAEDKKLSQSPFRLCCYMLGTLEFTYGLVALLVTLFQCQPINYNWDFVYQDIKGTCIDRLKFYYVGGSMVILFDILTIFLPLPKLMKLGLPLYTKIGIFLTFLVGFGVTASSLFRIQYLDTVMSSNNITYDIYTLQIWSFVELYLSMVCCSMPPMAGILRRSWAYMKFGGRLPTHSNDPHNLIPRKSAISKPYQRVDVALSSDLTEPRRAPIIRITGPPGKGGGGRDGVWQPTAPLPLPVLPESPSRVGLAL